MRRLRAALPFRSGVAARSALNDIMRTVEDEFSGIAENPDAANSPPDGRMYPPHEKFEKVSGSPCVKLFKQTGHQTWIGENGAIRIERSDAVVEIDEAGADLKTINDLLSENRR